MTTFEALMLTFTFGILVVAICLKTKRNRPPLSLRNF